MAKAIINKHIDSISGVVLSSKFDNDSEKQKGEILICNDPDNPTIYIMDTNGNPTKVAGSSNSGETYDDSKIWEAVNQNAADIDSLEENMPDTTIPEQIIVAGLDGQFGAGNYKNNDIIPAGTDIYTILQNILCKELYPTNVKHTKAKASAKMNNLILKLNETGIVEVGTLIKLISGETNGCTVSKTNSSVIGMTYGYSYDNDGTRDSNDTSIIKTCETQIADNDYTISAVIEQGFDADNSINIKTTPSTQFGAGYASLEETMLGCANEGMNKITISASGASFSYHADKIDKVYYCSNLGKTTPSIYHDGVEETNGTTNKATESASAEVTGAYYYFMGYSKNTSYDQFDSVSIRNLTVKKDWVLNNGTTTIVGNDTMTSNGDSIVIACPDTYQLATIDNPPANLKPLFLTEGAGSDGVISVKCGEIYVNYHVYVYPITNNSKVEFKNVTLTKKE